MRVYLPERAFPTRPRRLGQDRRRDGDRHVRGNGESMAQPMRASPTDDEEEPEDAALVARARGDPRAFAPLYARYARPVYRYCWRRLGSHEAAEDATSQTFTKALAALDRCDGAAFRAWLFTIAHNVVTDLYRRRQPRADLEALEAMPDDALGPEAVALADEERRSVQRVLARLRPEQRRVVELRLAGLTGPEIAAVLGRRPEAVKSTQHRAYARLRQLLGDEVGDGEIRGRRETDAAR